MKHEENEGTAAVLSGRRFFSGEHPKRVPVQKFTRPFFMREVATRGFGI
jgi:hypothetical protein